MKVWVVVWICVHTLNSVYGYALQHYRILCGWMVVAESHWIAVSPWQLLCNNHIVDLLKAGMVVKHVMIENLHDQNWNHLTWLLWTGGVIAEGGARRWPYLSHGRQIALAIVATLYGGPLQTVCICGMWHHKVHVPNFAVGEIPFADGKVCCELIMPCCRCTVYSICTFISHLCHWEWRRKGFHVVLLSDGMVHVVSWSCHWQGTSSSALALCAIISVTITSSCACRCELLPILPYTQQCKPT